MVDVIEIQDPSIDQDAVRRRVKARIAQQLAAGGYGPDPTTMGPALLRKPVEEKSSSIVRFPGLNRVLVDLIGYSSLHEPKFTSSIPLLGPLIVMFRQVWNWMSTKWYVLPLIRQQSMINNRMGVAISEVAQWQEINARRLVELEARIAELEVRLVKDDERNQRSGEACEHIK